MPLRILDEGQFWKHQEAEHTQVIRALAPNLEAPFVAALEKWELAFQQTEALFVRYIEAVARSGATPSSAVMGQIRELVLFSANQSVEFIAFLDQLAAESVPIKTNMVAKTVLHHIRRESEYFVGITQAMLTEKVI